MEKQIKVSLTKQRKKKYIKLIERAIKDYYLFIPTAILNEAINLPEFKDKYKKMYKQITELKRMKNNIEKL